MTFDALHDYWIVIYLDSDATSYNTNLVLWQAVTASTNGCIWSNHTGGNVMPSSSGGTSISTLAASLGLTNLPLTVGLLVG